ncbi:MAG: FAD-dependent oxidoreductase [Parcubacteria group bacterium]|nr:FAD-dependent oxidoreductase [Parcubacteria group bacterium]
MLDLAIIGGGPAGVAAGVYAARKKIKTALITDAFGGQSVVSDEIQNFVGLKSVSGLALAQMMEWHLRAQEGIEIVFPDRAAKIEKTAAGFSVATESGKKIETLAVLWTAGSRRRELGGPGEAEFEGRGVAYCSTCDAPVFKGKAVAVVGGGNSGLEAAVDLFPYASRVYLVIRGEDPRGDPLTLEKIKANPNAEIIASAEILSISGDNFVSGLRYRDKKIGEEKELPVGGVFVEIGSVPNVNPVKELVEINAAGEIAVDHRTQKTSLEGIWAAGDATDVLYKQNNISMGDAVKAVLNVYDWLKRRQKS